MIDNESAGDGIGNNKLRHLRNIPTFIRVAAALIIALILLVAAVPDVRKGMQKIYCFVVTCGAPDIEELRSAELELRNIVTEFGSNANNPANAAASKASSSATAREKP